MNLKIELKQKDIHSILKNYIEQEITTKEVASVQFIVEKSFGVWQLEKAVVTLK